MNIRTDVRNFPLVVVSKKIQNANAILPRNLQWMLYIAASILSDAIMIFLSFTLAYYFRFELFTQYFNSEAIVSFQTYQILLYTMPFLWLVIFAMNGLYVKGGILGGARQY